MTKTSVPDILGSLRKGYSEGDIRKILRENTLRVMEADREHHSALAATLNMPEAQVIPRFNRRLFRSGPRNRRGGSTS
jgi:hypothetical protein